MLGEPFPHLGILRDPAPAIQRRDTRRPEEA